MSQTPNDLITVEELASIRGVTRSKAKRILELCPTVVELADASAKVLSRDPDVTFAAAKYCIQHAKAKQKDANDAERAKVARELSLVDEGPIPNPKEPEQKAPTPTPVAPSPKIEGPEIVHSLFDRTLVIRRG